MAGAGVEGGLTVDAELAGAALDFVKSQQRQQELWSMENLYL